MAGRGLRGGDGQGCDGLRGAGCLQYAQVAESCYEAGADGLAFWDSYTRYYRTSGWAFGKRLGHRADLARWESKGDNYFRMVLLKKPDGFPMDFEFAMLSDG